MRLRRRRLSAATGDHRGALIRLQRDLWKRNREKIRAHEQVLTPDFAAYEAGYHADLAGITAEVVSFGRLVGAVRAADVTLVGDYHTLQLSQKTFLKIARRIRASRTVLALEFFESTHQDALDAWLAGRIKDKTLLRRTEYTRRWPYEIWPHFKPIMDLARRRGWRVVGLDCDRQADTRLAASDRFMAARIVDVLREARRGTRVLVLVGELHVARPHLPAELTRQAAEADLAPSLLAVLQNADEVYWQVAEGRRDQDVEVARIDETRYCMLNTPPMVVQQSYLSWIDSHVDSVDYNHVEEDFHHLLAEIRRVLGVRGGPTGPRLQVVAPCDVDGLELLDDLELLDGLIDDMAAERSRVILEHGLVYLGSLSLNQVGEAAGRLLHCELAHFDESELTGFYPHVIHDALGFLGSKIINPKRKVRQTGYYREALREVRQLQPADDQDLEVASAVLLHKALEAGDPATGFHRIFTLQPATRARIARALGKMLGERLFHAFVRDKVRRTDLRDWLSFRVTDPEQAAALYFTLARRVGRTSVPRRV